MACRGVYFALTTEEEQQLLACASNDEVMTLIEEIEERWDEEHLVETDKAWDAIHRCLGDGSRKPKGKSSLEGVVLGGKSLYKGNEYIVTYRSAAEVTELAAEMRPITEQWFRDRYFALKQKRFFPIGASDYSDFVSEEDFEYTWSYFQEIRDFYEKSAKQNRSVIFTVDQ